MTQIARYSALPQTLDCEGGVQLSEEHVKHDREHDLLIALRAGSSEAFERLRKLYSKRLYRRILSITGNHEDAEDALQDTFMRAFLAFKSFQGRSHVSTWLMRIAINSALLVLRRRRRVHAEVSLTLLAASDGEYQEFDIRDSAPTPEEICDLKQRLGRMFGAFDRLDPTSRSAIESQITDECSMKEIADTLDVSVAAVKARLHRARKRLVRSVEHKCAITSHHERSKNVI